MCIATIAHWDWPEKWPNLVGELVKCLSSKNMALVEGVVCCLEMIASGENLTSDHIPPLVQNAFPALRALFTSESANGEIRDKTLSIINHSLGWLGIIQSGVFEEKGSKKKLNNVKQIVKLVVEQWTPIFFQIASQPDNSTKDFTFKKHSVNVCFFPTSSFSSPPSLFSFKSTLTHQFTPSNSFVPSFGLLFFKVCYQFDKILPKSLQ